MCAPEQNDVFKICIQDFSANIFAVFKTFLQTFLLKEMTAINILFLWFCGFYLGEKKKEKKNIFEKNKIWTKVNSNQKLIFIQKFQPFLPVSPVHLCLFNFYLMETFTRNLSLP